MNTSNYIIVRESFIRILMFLYGIGYWATSRMWKHAGSLYSYKYHFMVWVTLLVTSGMTLETNY